MKKTAIHLLLILIFLSIPILSSPDFDGSFRMLRVPMFQKSFLEMILLIIFFYFNYFFLMPKFFNTHRYWKYFLCVFVCFLLVAVIPNVLIQDHFHAIHNLPPDFKDEKPPFHEKPPLHENHSFHKKFERDNHFWEIFRSILPFSFSLLCSLFINLYLKKKEAETLKNKAELLNLRYQLQPHFLFNILNNIYSLSILKSDDAPESILKLSNVMRYVVNEANKDFVSLKDELTYLNDYIALQIIRTDESLDFDFFENIQNENLKIAPMILVIFVENAFKYGFNAEEDSVIKISISTENDTLFFKVFNKVVNNTVPKNMSTKIGLNNTLERLKELYPEKHQIEIKQTETEHEVNLVMKLE